MKLPNSLNDQGFQLMLWCWLALLVILAIDNNRMNERHQNGTERSTLLSNPPHHRNRTEFKTQRIEDRPQPPSEDYMPSGTNGQRQCNYQTHQTERTQ